MMPPGPESKAMASQRRKKPSAAQGGAREPAELAWRQPPVRSRKQMKRNQAVAPRVISASSSSKTRPTVRPGPAPASARVPHLNVRRILLAALIVGLAAGAWRLLSLPQLRVAPASTQVGGNQRIASSDIFTASRIDGRSIFLVRPSQVAERVAALPGIAGAAVHVRLPNQVLIDVTEQTPLVAWQSPTGTVWLTAAGAEVPSQGEPPPLTLNDLTGRSPEAVRDTQQAVLSNLAELHAARPDLTDLYYGTLEGLYFRAPEGWTVYLGETGSLATKLALLAATQQKLAEQGDRPQVIDLRFDETQAFWW